jgi:hypothetical protein
MNDFDHLELRALSAVASQLAYIRRIDQLLDMVNELLNLYQPPRSGKIRIERWKRTKAGISVYAPMAVKWLQHKTTRRWRGVVVSTFKVSRSGKTAREFHDHRHRVQQYLATVQELLQLRSQAFIRLETFRRSVMLAERAQLPQLLSMGLKLQADLAAAPPELRALQRAEPQWLEDE